MNVQQNIPLAPLTTFKVGGPARYFTEARTAEEVRQAAWVAREQGWPLFVLGGGSNLVVADEGWPGLVLKVGIRGIVECEIGGKRLFEAGAGEDWDQFVALSVARDCAGVETLSGIPGTVGGTPVQNVGAYGQEVSETIASVRALDRQTMEFRDMTPEDCRFAYRSSIFNSTERDRYIVLRVTYALRPKGEPNIQYADLQKYFAKSTKPSLQQVRDAVREVRQSKAMLIVEGDDDCRSAGSFFKNPVVAEKKYLEIAEAFAREQNSQNGSQAAPPKYLAGSGKVKVPAAWLVEKAGFHKGYGKGRVGVSKKHTLAIVNRGGATAAEILALRDEIRRGVRDKFGVELVQEPVLVGFDVAETGAEHAAARKSE